MTRCSYPLSIPVSISSINLEFKSAWLSSSEKWHCVIIFKVFNNALNSLRFLTFSLNYNSFDLEATLSIYALNREKMCSMNNCPTSKYTLWEASYIWLIRVASYSISRSINFSFPGKNLPMYCLSNKVRGTTSSLSCNISENERCKAFDSLSLALFSFEHSFSRFQRRYGFITI